MTLLTELQRRNVIRVGVPSSEFISAELSHAARKGEEAAVLVAVARRRIRSADVVEGRVWRALSSEETSNTKVDVDVNGREGRRRTEEWPESPADATAPPSEPPKRRSLPPQMNAADRSSRHQDPKREPLRTNTQSRRGAAE